MKIIHFPQYAAPYKGGFIGSLENLTVFSTNYHFVFCFPENAKKMLWMDNFKTTYKTYFTKNDVRNSANELLNILYLENPDIIHSHFDGYDLPLLKAKYKYFKETKKDVEIIWHLHNQISFVSNPLKKIYQKIILKYKYGIKAKEVNIISVSQEMMNFVKIRRGINFNKYKSIILPNGIIRPQSKKNLKSSNLIFTFGAFGGRNEDKRIDVLLQASEILTSKIKNFRVTITKGVDTEEIVKYIYKDELPEWLILEEQTNNVGDFYGKLDCFISTSIHETFSNAIGEATLMLLPVIQSDIEGTLWNAKNPSTILFKTIDPYDLALKMEEVMNRNKEELKQNCLITAQNNEEKYGIKNWCKDLLDFYQQIVE